MAIGKKKIIRITTVPQSLRGLLRGQLKFMNQFYEVIGISSPGEPLDDVRKNEGIQVIPVEMTRSITPFKDIKSVWKLYRIFKKEKPEIVHTHTPKAGTVGMLAAKLAGVPIRLHTVAGLPLMETSGMKRQILNWVEKVTYKCATMIYPNSFGLKDFILDSNFTSQNKLKILGHGSSNGIDTDEFSIDNVSETKMVNLQRELGIDENDFILIFIGRIVKDKGIVELIETFKLVTEKYPDVKLILVGSYEKHLDPLPVEIETEINNNKKIFAVGYQSDVKPYLSISNVLVFPSYREGLPNVPMQACSMGVPCIVSDINGCNEIITDDKNGLVIPVKNVEKLNEAIIKLISNKELLTKLKSNTRKSIKGKYDRQFVWGEIKKEYDNLLKRHHA